MPPKKVIKKGLPPWMATFADLCTLLLTFFVLLLTFANMDIQKFRDMLGSVQMAFGVQFQETGQFQPVKTERQGTERFQPVEQQRRMFSSMKSKEPDMQAVQEDRQAAEAADMAKQVESMINKEGLKDVAEVSAGAKGVRLRIKGTLMFDPGQARVKSGAKSLLDGIAKVMTKFQFYLTVEGHTDATAHQHLQVPQQLGAEQRAGHRGVALFAPAQPASIPHVRGGLCGQLSPGQQQHQRWPAGKKPPGGVCFHQKTHAGGG
jgi:flagellar motor protein MotB